jgi:hypothetical protein
MARKRRRKSKQSNKLTYYIIAAAVFILIIFAFPNVGKFTDAEESQWEGKLTIPGESELGDVPVRYLKLSDGSFAVTNRPKNWNEIEPSSGRGVGESINIYFDHKDLKMISYDSDRSQYFAEDYYRTESYTLGPSYSLREIISMSKRHTISSPRIFGSYWIDYTGEARIDGKTPAEIEAVKAAAKAAEEQKAAEKKAEEERQKQAEEDRKQEEQEEQELEQKKQAAKQFLDEWEEIYLEHGFYPSDEAKNLRAIKDYKSVYTTPEGEVRTTVSNVVTNSPKSYGSTKQEISRAMGHIRKSDGAEPYTITNLYTSYGSNVPSVMYAIKATTSKQVWPDWYSQYWFDETGEVYDVLEVTFAETQDDVKSQEDPGEPEMESVVA